MGEMDNWDPYVIRTDFSDDAGWQAICAEIGSDDTEYGFVANTQFIDDRKFENKTPDAIRRMLGKEFEDCYGFFFVVDSVCFSSEEHPILCIKIPSKYSPNEDQFRVIPSEMWGVENNLSISNMDFESFSGKVDEDGVLRGFD